MSAEETKSKLIIERHERDKEMNNNKLMVQELQKLVTDERLEKEKLSQAEAQISRLKEELECWRLSGCRRGWGTSGGR